MYCFFPIHLALLVSTIAADTKFGETHHQNRRVTFPAYSIIGIQYTAVPGPVLDVDVYVYYPIRSDQSDISALVVWNMPDGTVPVTNFTVQVFNSNGMNVGTITTNSNGTFARLETRSPLNVLNYVLQINNNYTITVSASSNMGSGSPSTPASFSTYAPSPHQELFAVGSSLDVSTIVNTNIQGPCPVAVNTIDREVYWYSSSKQLLRGYFDSNVVQNLVSSTLMPMMSNLTVLALAYDWVGERVYFAARAGGSFSLWRVPLINPAGLENVFTGPSINDSSSVQLIVDPFSGYAYWTAQEAGMTVLYQQNLRAVNGTIPTRRLDQSSTHIQLLAMTLDPTNGYLWVSDATTGNILSCDAMTWACSVEVNATALGNGGLPATSIALDEVHVYWTRQNTPGIFYMSLNGPATLQILSNTNPFAIFSTSPGQQPLPTQSCLSYDRLTRPVPYQISATNSSILIGWSVPSLPAACQSTVFSFPTLTYVVDLRQFMQPLPQYPAPGVITMGTTFTLDRGLSPFMVYNVQVAAYNQYTVALTSFMYIAATGVVTFYGPLVNVMTTEGVPGSPTNLTAFTTGTQSILVSWVKPKMALYFGNPQNIQFYIYVYDTMVAKTTNTSIRLNSSNNISPETNYFIKVLTFNGAFASANPTSAMVTTWPLPPLPTVTNALELTNTTALSINVTLFPKHFPITELFVQVEPITPISNFTMDSERLSLVNTTIPLNGITLQFTVKLTNQTVDNVWVWAVAAYVNMDVRRGPQLLYGTGKPTDTTASTAQPKTQLTSSTQGSYITMLPTGGPTDTTASTAQPKTQLTSSTQGSYIACQLINVMMLALSLLIV